jgi:hypothetical protein
MTLTSEIASIAVWLVCMLFVPSYLAIYFHGRLRSTWRAVALSVAISAPVYFVLSYLLYLFIKNV